MSFLLYVLIIETVGSYPVYLRKYESLNWIEEAFKNTIFESNYWWYTLFWTIGSTAFFGFYYYNIVITKRIQSCVKWISLFCFFLSILLFVVYNDIFKSNYIIVLDIINFFLILFLVFIYLMELLYSEKVLIFYKSLPFYVSVGIFSFWIVTTPVGFFEEYYNTSDQGFIFLKLAIKICAITFTYLIFAFGLIVSNPEKRT